MSGTDRPGPGVCARSSGTTRTDATTFTSRWLEKRSRNGMVRRIRSPSGPAGEAGLHWVVWKNENDDPLRPAVQTGGTTPVSDVVHHDQWGAPVRLPVPGFRL